MAAYITARIDDAEAKKNEEIVATLDPDPVLNETLSASDLDLHLNSSYPRTPAQRQAHNNQKLKFATVVKMLNTKGVKALARPKDLKSVFVSIYAFISQ